MTIAGAGSLGLVVATLAAYVASIRPRMLRWGATGGEVRQPFLRAGIIPGAVRSSSTMAVTIDAPPSNVWPWSIQMGCKRAGWYSWDHLDNFGTPSAEALRAEWQNIARGDRLPALPDGSQKWEVAAL